MKSVKIDTVAAIIQLSLSLIRHNLKIVFGGKFIYFLLSALVFYFIITLTNLNSNYNLDTAEIYHLLIFPALLTVFYPIIYNIQNDKGARMLEIIFSIPNYRYKVYLLRFIISLLIMMTVVFFMACFTWFSITRVSVGELVFQLFYPLFFVSSLAFLFTTLTKNGNTSAVLIILIGLIFLLFQDPMQGSKWFIFLNPFKTPLGTNATVWHLIVQQNRTILLIGSAICLLWALINLQKREKFL